MHMTSFVELKHFIEKDMRMSHIYQPVMLITILKNKGHASVKQIAEAILKQDPTQIEYYSEIVKRMVGQVLTNKRGIAVRNGDQYTIKAVENFSDIQITELLALLELKIQEFNVNRNESQWNHRKRGRRPIPGSVRFEVLKRAKFRCELCGISADKKNLEVDHIVPKSLSGKDDISNYQALCYTCNVQKNNKDRTDFRGLNAEYDKKVDDCLFCTIQDDDSRKIYAQNTLGFAIFDAFPVTKGHLLFIPKRHVEQYFDFTQAEINAINMLISESREKLISSDKEITGFNIGINCGESAGQTILHGHVHLLPRRDQDVKNPKGGIRNVIVGKGSYGS